MQIESIKENDKPNSPVIWVDKIKLKVGDGVRLGFGFGIGMFLWGVLLTAIFMVSLIFVGNIIVNEIKGEINSAFGIPAAKSSVVPFNTSMNNVDLNRTDLNKLSPDVINQIKQQLK